MQIDTHLGVAYCDAPLQHVRPLHSIVKKANLHRWENEDAVYWMEKTLEKPDADIAPDQISTPSLSHGSRSETETDTSSPPRTFSAIMRRVSVEGD
jgi:hypothetical protein